MTILPHMLQSEHRKCSLFISPKCPTIAVLWTLTADQTTLLLLAPLNLKSGMLHTLCTLSPRSIPLSTSSDTVFRSLNPAPSATAEVRPTVLPKGLILMRDLKFMRDTLTARLLFHWRASCWASCSSFRWSRVSWRTERNSPDTSCTSGSLTCMTSLNLSRDRNTSSEVMTNATVTQFNVVFNVFAHSLLYFTYLSSESKTNQRVWKL